MPIRIENLKMKLSSGKKYYKAIKYPEIPFSSSDLYVITTDRDRLDLLADQFYNDVDYWWIIANANPGIIRRDSFLLKPGIEIRIPRNLQKIFIDFDKINK